MKKKKRNHGKTLKIVILRQKHDQSRPITTKSRPITTYHDQITTYHDQITTTTKSRPRPNHDHDQITTTTKSSIYYEIISTFLNFFLQNFRKKVFLTAIFWKHMRTVQICNKNFFYFFFEIFLFFFFLFFFFYFFL
jgi:hypothetical protein